MAGATADQKETSHPHGSGLLVAEPSGPLTGVFATPGDKSVSHRALIFAALSTGETTIEGLLEGDDVVRTGRALEAMGAGVERRGPGAWTVRGLGVQGLRAPGDVLDFGNSGTGVRLMMGVLAGHPFPVHVTGDASLRSRPMERVIAPLRLMGLEADLAEGGRLPARLRGGEPLVPIAYDVPVPSAQVKSAVLLAGLHAPGETTVIEAVPTRDHTERLLRSFGAEVSVSVREDGASVITLQGQPELTGRAVRVPGDPSSAAFALVAGAIVPGSDLTLSHVMLNDRRTGLITCLQEMGADLTIHARDGGEGGEPMGDLHIRADGLKGIHVPAERAPSMIDEYPALAMAAACATGTSVFEGLHELRVKESDRLAAVAEGLSACGVSLEVEGDRLTVEGLGSGGVPGGAVVDSRGDHRIAMAFAVLGLGSKAPVTVTQASMIATSFPGFAAMFRDLGASMREVEEGSAP